MRTRSVIISLALSALAACNLYFGDVQRNSKGSGAAPDAGWPTLDGNPTPDGWIVDPDAGSGCHTPDASWGSGYPDASWGSGDPDGGGSGGGSGYPDAGCC